MSKQNDFTTTQSQIIQLPAQLKTLNQSLTAQISPSLIYAISPSVSVAPLPNGNYLITVVDKNGTTTTEIETHSPQTNNVYISATEPENAKTGDIWFVIS